MIFCVTAIDLVSTFRLSKLVKVYEQKVCFFVDVPACKIRSALSPSQASSVVHTVGTDFCTLKGSPSVKKNPKTNRTVNWFNLFVKLLHCQLQVINDLTEELGVYKMLKFGKNSSQAGLNREAFVSYPYIWVVEHHQEIFTHWKVSEISHGNRSHHHSELNIKSTNNKSQHHEPTTNIVRPEFLWPVHYTMGLIQVYPEKAINLAGNEKQTISKHDFVF